MGQTFEIRTFFVLATIILLVFINGILIFIMQYRKRKLLHEKEKTMINEKHTEELLHTRVEIQAQTMQDIGREIHDNVGQRLTLAAIYANQLSHANTYPEINNRITEVGNIINESLAELRSLSKNLTSANIDATELVALIENECKRVSALNMCRVSFSFEGTNYHISTTVKNFIVRILQEFMQNSLKHASCKNITVRLSRTDEGLRVIARDDGIGFNTASPSGTGIGLQNMKKRAELIGAVFVLTAAINKGTTLELFISTDKLNN